MRVLLVSPGQATSLFTFSDVEDITGSRSYMPNLALPTLSALVPSDIDLTIVDEMVEPVGPYYEEDWDLVGITGYITHSKRMFEVADEFRRRGRAGRDWRPLRDPVFFHGSATRGHSFHWRGGENLA